MQSMDQDAYKRLVADVGKEMADNVVNALNSQGKSIENLGTAYKMPMGSDEDEKEDMEDEDEPPFPPKKSHDLTTPDLVLFSSMKTLSDITHGLHKEVDEVRKTQKDGNNQIEQLRDKIGDVEDSLRRIEQHFQKLTTRQPASTSAATQFMGNYPPVDTAYQKNQEGQDAPVPIFNQMKSNSAYQMPNYQMPPSGKPTE
jgi:hypothetical protein